MRWLVHVMLVAALIALGVAFAVSRKHVIDLTVHDRYARGLRSMAALDATLNDEVLQADKGIVRHYDPVVHTLGELRRIPPGLRTAPQFLSPAGRAEVEHDVALFAEALRDKEELIEQFKSEAAVLRNSLHYFPIAADAFEKSATDPQQAMLAEQLLRHLLLYNQRPDHDLRTLADADLAKLGARAPKRTADAGLQLLSTHASVILDRRPQVDAILKRIGALPTAHRVEDTYRAYDRHYQRAVEIAALYRLLIYLLSALAIGLATGDVVVTLRRSAAALSRERENVERLLLNTPGVVIRERYQLDRRLGEGGMGVVWSARCTKTDAPVALKFVKNMGAGRQDLRRRFLREARAASLLNHPNVVRIREILELEDGSPVLVMDLLTGRSLGEHLVKSGVIPLGELAAILRPVVDAIAAAHDVGIIHRDLKPDNIFLVELPDGGRDVRVLDFGAAKLTAVDGLAAQSGNLTRTGDVIGTPFYMSPEQAFGEPGIDARTDVWSLGVIVYECLTGRRPFAGENQGQLLKQILSDEAPPLDRALPGISEDVNDLVRAMLVKDRASRLADLSRVLAVFARHAGGAVNVADG